MSKRICISLPPEMYEKLKKESEETLNPMTNIVRRALKEYLEKEKGEKQPSLSSSIATILELMKIESNNLNKGIEKIEKLLNDSKMEGK